MRRPEFIARQSGNPSGILGRLLAWVMERETAAQNAAALADLAIDGDDRVLEVGFGHARTLQRIAAGLRDGSVAGVDHSPDMVRRAAHRCRRGIAAGRIDVRQASSDRLPYGDAHFDKVLAVHTIYFWADPLRHLREIHRVLRPGGLLVLGFRARSEAATADFPASVYAFHDADRVADMLSAVGFDSVDIRAAPTASSSFLLARAVRRADDRARTRAV